MINSNHPLADTLSKENKRCIESLHTISNIVVNLAKESEEIAIILFPLWEEIEYSLQKLWGFPEDPKYHKSYNYPYCICPKLDNEDSYPHLSYRTEGCPIHKE